MFEMKKKRVRLTKEDFGTEDDVQELVTCSEQDEELITLVLVPEDQEHKLPKNRNFRLQSHLF